MEKIKKNEPVENKGRVVVYGVPSVEKDHDNNEIIKADYNQVGICEILDVQDIFKDRIVTSKYVLPLKDATIHTSSEGTIYSYNCKLPYLQEVAHLAEVEQNIIISQAFAYSGRVQPKNQTPLIMYIMIAILGLIAIIGMFK